MLAPCVSLPLCGAPTRRAGFAWFRQHRRRILACKALNEDSNDEFTRRALREAVELVQQAQALAVEEARTELLQSWSAQARDSPVFTGPPSTSGASDEALALFWQEQGLSPVAAARLVRDLRSDDLQPGQPWTLEQLSGRLATLRRLLPGLDAARLVGAEPALLQADSGAVVSALLALHRGFPDASVLDMVDKLPRLLLLPAWELVEERIPRVVGKLVELHPSNDARVVAGIIEENPQLLFRMDYYLNVHMLDELPIEIQNMMVLADQGLGHLHRFWRQKNKERRERQEQQQQ